MFVDLVNKEIIITKYITDNRRCYAKPNELAIIVKILPDGVICRMKERSTELYLKTSEFKLNKEESK